MGKDIFEKLWFLQFDAFDVILGTWATEDLELSA